MTERVESTPQTRSLDLVQIDAELAEQEASRASQLAGIDTSPDEVTTAYRETVSRLLEEIRLARRRIAEGTYGCCVRCGTDIPAARLELRPWASAGTGCAG